MQRRKIRDDRLIGNYVVAIINCAVDGRLNTLLEIGNQITCIASEDFVATLSPQDYFGLSS